MFNVTKVQWMVYHFWFMQPYPKILVATRKRQVASERLLQTGSSFTKSVMVSPCPSWATRSVWPKISGRRGRHHQLFLHR